MRKPIQIQFENSASQIIIFFLIRYNFNPIYKNLNIPTLTQHSEQSVNQSSVEGI